jgi:hypothetical protein
MKNKVKPSGSISLMFIFLFSFSLQMFGQENVNISVGIGLPELLNINVGFPLEQAQIGVSIGTMPVKNERLISLSGDIYYHFSGSSEFSDIRPWYGRIGLNYLRDETERILDKYLYLNLRIGRDLNISHKIGIALDAGVMVEIFNEYIEKIPCTGWFCGGVLDFPVLPSLGIRLFYRL